MNIELIRNTIYKAYLEDFYRYCKELGGATAEIMSELLEVFFPPPSSSLRRLVVFTSSLGEDTSLTVYLYEVRGRPTSHQYYYQFIWY